jgi:phosphatidyl-myo-inositol dimannoside synthase
MAPPLRPLVLTPDFPPRRGGIQLLLDRVIRHTPSFASRVVTLTSPGAKEFDAEQPFEVHRVNWMPRSRRASFAWLNAVAVREARRFRPHAILSGHIVTAPAAWTIRKTLGPRAVQYLYADEVRAAPRLCAFAVRDASAVIVVSRHADALARTFGTEQSRIHRIPPGVDLPGETAPATRADRPTLLTVARLEDEYKGHDVILRALPLIKRRVPDIRWVVLGDGPLRPRLKRRAAEGGLEGNACFLGGVSDAERDHWYRTAHVFVMPSRLPAQGGGEGFGIVYLEAGARGLPVVAGNVGGALDAVVHGETGVLVDPTDPTAVAGAAVELLRSPERAARMGRNAAARAKRFAWPVIARQVEDLVLAVADRPAGRSRWRLADRPRS